MKKISILLIFLFALTLILSAPAKVRAEDGTMQFVLRDTVYGMVIGALLGTAAALSTDEPEDHWNYISVGALFGGASGLFYGVVYDTDAFVQIDKDGLSVGIPTLHTKVEVLDNNKKDIQYSVNLFKYCF